MMGGYGFHHGLSGWGWLAMTVSMLVFWGLLIAAGALLIRSWRRSSEPSPPSAHASAEELLAERFARGEIDEKEFHQRLATLTDARSAAGVKSGAHR